MTEKRRDQMRPESKWTIVGTETGRQFFVRFAPKNVDLEELGRPWGLALNNMYDDYEEAHRFADSVDLFMDAIFAAQSEERTLFKETIKHSIHHLRSLLDSEAEFEESSLVAEKAYEALEKL